MIVIRREIPAILALAALLCAGCSTIATDQGEPVVGDEVAAAAADEAEPEAPASTMGEQGKIEEGEVPLAVAQSEHHEDPVPLQQLHELVVVPGARHEQIHNLVTEAQEQLANVKLQYVFTGTGKKETLRGRPVAFALWSEAKMEWVIAQVEIPRPPVKWKPGGKPMPFLTLTPGINATHVKGTGAERLMFSFTRNGEPLKVYGRKFPVFDSDLLKKKNWRALADTAKTIVYLPFTADTLDPQFVTGGKDYLLATARRAIADLRAAHAPSMAYPGQSLADVVPPEVITTLAVIEQTDDGDFVDKGEAAFDEVLSQYGLKQNEAYRYSVSRASAIGPMQFTNGKKNNGTYAMVVKRCPEAQLDRDFERGATNLLNAMKAAICLFDLDLANMSADIRAAYHDNMKVLGIFPVASYNGGQKNVGRLTKVMKKMGVKLEDLRAQGEEPEGKINCPCLWKQVAGEVIPVPIPKYNNENRWYIEKYQSILSEFDQDPVATTPPTAANGG